jgi:hypothetical protein
MKIWTQKIHQSNVKIELKNKSSSNEELISEMHWKFPNIHFSNLKKNLNN